MFLGPLGSVREVWEPMLAVIAILTMTVGNLGALTQTNIKRLLAYSSISHAGYILLGLIAGNETGVKGVAVYVLVYTFMNLGAFLVIVALRRQDILGYPIGNFSGLYGGGGKQWIEAIESWMSDPTPVTMRHMTQESGSMR